MLGSDDLAESLELQLVVAGLDAVDLCGSLPLGLEYDFFLSEEPEGRYHADLYVLLEGAVVVEGGEVGEGQDVVLVLLILGSLFLFVDHAGEPAPVDIEVVGVLLEEVGLLGELDLPGHEDVDDLGLLVLLVDVLVHPLLGEGHAHDDFH